MSPVPGASAKFPGVIFEVRQKLLQRAGTGTTGVTVRRLRRLSTRLDEARWLEVCAAVQSLADLAAEAGKTRAELDEMLRDLLQREGSDDEP